MPSAGPDRQARIALALPALDAAARERAAEEDWDVDLLDPRNPDERAILIRLAHPHLADAIEEGRETVVVGGQPTNPRLHLAIHEVVATQIIDGDPPEAFETAERLLALGRDRHEVLHMLGFAASGQIWGALHEQRDYSREDHIRALAALPGSFDAEFAGSGNRAARRAHARQARRRRGRR